MLKKKFTHHYPIQITAVLFLLIFALKTKAQSSTDTLLIDFGSNPSAGFWNNISTPGGGVYNNLVNSKGFLSPLAVNIFDGFNSINTNGTTMPHPALGFPPTATGDSFFGNTVLFGGQIQPTGGVAISGLPVGDSCTLTIFASRTATDNRQTKYIIEGLTVDSFLLQASSNDSVAVVHTLRPDSTGTIRINAMPGPDNNNTYGFFYLGVIRVVYQSVTTNTTPSLTLISPVGGEYWQVGKTPSILWESENIGSVKLEYSTDAGDSWIVIDTVPAFTGKYPFIVPATPSENCLVRVSFDTLSGTGTAQFTIADDSVTCPIVVLGSSTAAGAGASTPDSAWVNRYSRYIFQKNTRFPVINLDRGGYTTYHILPDGAATPPGFAVDTARNITRALTYQPFAIIVNMPSNDAANMFTPAQQLANFDLIEAQAVAGGAQLWVCTTQPRNFGDPIQVKIQRDMADSIRARYGVRAIEFWEGFADSTGFILPELNSGDGIHLNNTGHRKLFERVKLEQIDTAGCVPEPTVSIENQGDARKSGIRLYPNPFSSVVHLLFETASAGEAVLNLRLPDGRPVLSATKSWPDAGPQQLIWNLPEAETRLPRGLYFFEVFIQENNHLRRQVIPVIHQ